MNQPGAGSEHRYLIAGLRLQSQIELPELVPFDFGDQAPDLEVIEAPVPEQLRDAEYTAQEAQVSRDSVLLSIPGIGRYLAIGGRQIRVQYEPAAEPRNVRIYLLGSALGAIWFQRGYLPLHASVVVMSGQAVAFTGDSGAGKSTMAAWMSSQGYPLLCDDVCVIRFDKTGEATAFPAFPRLKLWQDALDALGLESSKLQRDYMRHDKFHLPVNENFGTRPVLLKHICVLQFADTDAMPDIETIPAAESVHLLRNNTYRYQFIRGLGLTARHFEDCVRLARSTTVHRLSRPVNHAALAECQLLLENLVQ